MTEQCINIVEHLGGSLISRIFHYVFRHPALSVTITHTESRRFWQYSKQCSLFEAGEYQLDFFCGQIHAGQLTLSVNINPSSPIYLLISWNPITRRLSHSVFHSSSSFRTAAVHLRLRFPADYDRPEYSAPEMFYPPPLDESLHPAYNGRTTEHTAMNGKVIGARKKRERRSPAESRLADVPDEVHPGAVRMNVNAIIRAGRAPLMRIERRR